jgi:archaemetzincin
MAIQPFGQINEQDLAHIQNAVKKIYKKDIGILETKQLPENAFVNIKKPRYRADTLIRFLKRNQPDSIDIVLGLTYKDISTTKKETFDKTKKSKFKYQDWGVMGLGFRPGSSCVVSTFRLKSPNKKLASERLKKISIHEIGHNLGLKHCFDKNCVMTDACESINNIDNARLALCENCKSKIGL